jgi:hypothetical protein
LHLLRARLRLLAGDLHGARQDLKGVLALEPQLLVARLMGVEILVVEGEGERASAELGRALAPYLPLGGLSALGQPR